MQPNGLLNHASCLLCGSRRFRPVLTVSTAEIWRHLKEDVGVVFSAEEQGTILPTTEINLLACEDCQLEYFWPIRPGSDAFYDRLSSSAAYYVGDKWDFEFALRHVSRDQDVLDIACGSGHFVHLATNTGARAVGIDTNPDAVTAARSQGRNVKLEPLEAFAPANIAAFDLVTAFQVVEHVPDPVAFLREAAKCLRPTGRMIVTVPNRDRRFKPEWDVLDFPPHHLSRWSLSQMEELGRRAGLRCVAIHREPASPSEARALLRSALAPAAPHTIPARALGFLAFNRLTYPALLASGVIDGLKYWRMSLTGVFERQ